MTTSRNAGYGNFDSDHKVGAFGHAGRMLGNGFSIGHIATTWEEDLPSPDMSSIWETYKVSGILDDGRIELECIIDAQRLLKGNRIIMNPTELSNVLARTRGHFGSTIPVQKV